MIIKKPVGGSGDGHTHANKATLDKFGESNGTPTFSGAVIGGGGGSGVTSKWSGKVWNVVGDSITEKNARTTKNYHDYIKDKIGCTVNNYGLSGSGWFTHWNHPTDGVYAAFYNRLGALAANADLITVAGGTNDVAGTGKQLVIGSFGDTDPEVSFYGAVDYTLKALINKYPRATIATFTPIPTSARWGENNGSGASMVKVSDAILRVSRNYSIPCLDLYRESGFAPWNDTQKSAEMPDGLHPNDAGHQRMADKILAFLNSL